MDDVHKLHLLLSHYDSGEPVLRDGMPEEAAAEIDVEDVRSDTGPRSYWEEGGDPMDLEEQRWGVFVPDTPEGERLLELIRPLMEFRREQQGGHEIKTYRVPTKLSPTEAARWRKENFDTQFDVSADLPRYQLLLGDLHQLPLSVQQCQGTDGFVGRLCFREDKEYEAYVEKVLKWEKARTQVEPRAKFFTVHDGTAATMIGYRALIKPGIDILNVRHENIEDLGDKDMPSPSEFLDMVRDPTPTMLFSVSHGAGAPRGGWKSFEEQRDRQGAMSFGREGKLAGGDIGDAPFLPGGIWFMLACYGAGTPDNSAYRHWLEKLKSIGQFGGNAQSVLASLPTGDLPPFIARLPQRVLANPNGPLAVMGHIDLAWTYSFEERDSGKKPVTRPGKFMDLVRSALRGDRAGICFRNLVRFITHANKELSDLYDLAEREGDAHTADKARLGHLWMLRQDMEGYVLLGDPAVRIPAMKKPKAKAQAPDAPAAMPVSAPPVPEITTPTSPAPALPLPIEQLEEAIAHLLTGEQAPKALATKYNIDRGELERLAEIYKKAGRAALGEK